MEYILVYNGEKNDPEVAPEDFIDAKFSEYAKDEIIYFGLKNFKGNFFKDVHTYTKDEFNEKYKYLVEN